MTHDAGKEMRRRALEDFPPEITGEHPAIDLLRQVHTLAKTTACLLDDARIYGDLADEQAYAEFLDSVANDAAKLMLSVAEDAMLAITNKGK